MKTKIWNVLPATFFASLALFAAPAQAAVIVGSTDSSSFGGRSVDLRSIAEVNNNSILGFQLGSEFSSTPTGAGFANYIVSGTSSTYRGHNDFSDVRAPEMVGFSGVSPVPEPALTALYYAIGLLAICGGCAFRSRASRRVRVS